MITGKAIKIIATFTIVCIGWIFFRANTLNDAMYIINDISELSNYNFSQLSLYVIPVSKNTVFAMDIFLSLIFVLLLLLVEVFNKEDRFVS